MPIFTCEVNCEKEVLKPFKLIIHLFVHQPFPQTTPAFHYLPGEQEAEVYCRGLRLTGEQRQSLGPVSSPKEERRAQQSQAQWREDVPGGSYRGITEEGTQEGWWWSRKAKSMRKSS